MKKVDKQEKKQQKKDNKDIKLLDAKVGELQELISSLQEEKKQTFEQLQRVSADYANYQKRTPKQISDSVAYEKEKFLKAILGSIDNFELALDNKDKSNDLETFVKGIQMVHDEIMNTFNGLGLKAIDAVGQKFDPSKHEALMQQYEEGTKENIILQQYQKGYTLNDKVVRPSKVIVNKKPAPAPEPQEKADEPDEKAETKTETQSPNDAQE